MDYTYAFQVFLYICLALLFVACAWIAFFSDWSGKPATSPPPPSRGNPEEFRKRADAFLDAMPARIAKINSDAGK